MRPHISTLPTGISAYSNDKCRCADCREEWRLYCADLVVGRMARPDLHPVPHGTVGGYRNYGCRCESCRQAQTESSRRSNAKRRQAVSA